MIDFKLDLLYNPKKGVYLVTYQRGNDPKLVHFDFFEIFSHGARILNGNKVTMADGRKAVVFDEIEYAKRFLIAFADICEFDKCLVELKNVMERSLEDSENAVLQKEVAALLLEIIEKINSPDEEDIARAMEEKQQHPNIH